MQPGQGCPRLGVASDRPVESHPQSPPLEVLSPGWDLGRCMPLLLRLPGFPWKVLKNTDTEAPLAGILIELIVAVNYRGLKFSGDSHTQSCFRATVVGLSRVLGGFMIYLEDSNLKYYPSWAE